MKSPKNTLEAAVRRATAMAREQGRYNYDGAVTGRITVSGDGQADNLPDPETAQTNLARIGAVMGLQSKPVAWLLEKPDGETHITECRPRDDWKDGTVTPLYAASTIQPAGPLTATGRTTVSGPETQTLLNPLFPTRMPAPTEADFRNMDFAEVEGRIAAHAIAEGVDMDMGHFIPDRNRLTLAKRSVHDIGGVHVVANEFAAKAVVAAVEEAATGPISIIHVKPGPHIVATDHAGRTVATFYIAGALAQVIPEIRSVFEAEGYEVIA